MAIEIVLYGTVIFCQVCTVLLIWFKVQPAVMQRASMAQKSKPMPKRTREKYIVYNDDDKAYEKELEQKGEL